MTNDELSHSPPSEDAPEVSELAPPPPPPHPEVKDSDAQDEPRPEPLIYAMLRKAGIAGGIGVLTGLILSSVIVVWGYSGMPIRPLHLPGAAATVLGAAFGGRLTETMSSQGAEFASFTIQGSIWVLALIVVLVIAFVARRLHRSDSASSMSHLWGQAALSGAVVTLVITVVTFLPANVASYRDESSFKLAVSLWPAVLGAFIVGMGGYALGIVRLKEYGGVQRLGLRLPSWIRIPGLAVSLHVGIVIAAAIGVSTVYALTASFVTTAGPGTAISLDGMSALLALTALAGWGYAEQDALRFSLPEIGSTVTAVSGHPMWMIAIMLIAAILAFFVAAITLSLRRPLGRGQWNGVGITLGLYALAGLTLILFSRTDSSALEPSRIGQTIEESYDIVAASWWSMATVLVIGLAVECAARFIAPKVLSLMPGIVRKYGRVPGPDVNR